MPEQALQQTSNTPSPTAAQAPVQRSASGALRGGLREQGLESQTAMLEPVQRRAPVGARPAAPVQMHAAGGGRTIQRLAVQREESATPHRDAALAHVDANPVPGAAPDAEGTAPTITVPRDYGTYCAHIREKFAGEIAEIRQLNLDFNAQGGAIKMQEEKLKLDAEEVNWYRHEYDVTKGKLSEVDEQRRKTLGALEVHVDKTMEQLYNEAKALIDKHEGKAIKLKEDRTALEVIMLAAMELASQVNPDASGKTRALYMGKIDNEENQRLVALAQEQQMPPAELATLAVSYRTWSKTFVRTEMMEHSQTAEILFMRDLGLDGLQVGKTPASLAAGLLTKVYDAKGTPIEERVPFAKIEEDEKLKIYEGMIAKAKETNPNVNAMMGPRKQRPLDTPPSNTADASSGASTPPPQ